MVGSMLIVRSGWKMIDLGRLCNASSAHPIAGRDSESDATAMSKCVDSWEMNEALTALPIWGAQRHGRLV